jgi:hypothetical protein
MTIKNAHKMTILPLVHERLGIFIPLVQIVEHGFFQHTNGSVAASTHRFLHRHFNRRSCGSRRLPGSSDAASLVGLGGGERGN